MLDRKFCAELSSSHAAEMSDIVNGQYYRHLVESSGHPQSKWNITLTLNTDGVSVFQTSRNGTLWSVYLTVNELSPKSR